MLKLGAKYLSDCNEAASFINLIDSSGTFMTYIWNILDDFFYVRKVNYLI